MIWMLGSDETPVFSLGAATSPTPYEQCMLAQFGRGTPDTLAHTLCRVLKSAGDAPAIVGAGLRLTQAEAAPGSFPWGGVAIAVGAVALGLYLAKKWRG